MSMGNMFGQGIPIRDWTLVANFCQDFESSEIRWHNGQSGDNTSIEVKKIKREDLPDSIQRVCEEVEAVFPKDSPKGIPSR